MADPESVDSLIKCLQSLGFEPWHVTSQIAWRAPYRNVDGSRHYGELLAADSWERLRELLLVTWQKEAVIYCQHTIHALNKQVLYRMMVMRRSKSQVLDALETRGESVADIVELLHWLSFCDSGARDYFNSFKRATTWKELRKLLDVETCVKAASDTYGQGTAFILLDEMWFLLFRKECARVDVSQVTNLFERLPAKRERDDNDDEEGPPAYATDEQKKKKKKRFLSLC
jgi:hypothetical protein